MAIGLALPIATLSVFYYDVHHALPIALTSLFYLSPVFYPASLVPSAYQTLYFLNPIAGAAHPLPRRRLRRPMAVALLLAGTAAQAAIVYTLGYAVFHRYATVFAEIV